MSKILPLSNSEFLLRMENSFYFNNCSLISSIDFKKRSIIKLIWSIKMLFIPYSKIKINLHFETLEQLQYVSSHSTDFPKYVSLKTHCREKFPVLKKVEKQTSLNFGGSDISRSIRRCVKLYTPYISLTCQAFFSEVLCKYGNFRA